MPRHNWAWELVGWPSQAGKNTNTVALGGYCHCSLSFPAIFLNRGFPSFPGLLHFLSVGWGCRQLADHRSGQYSCQSESHSEITANQGDRTSKFDGLFHQDRNLLMKCKNSIWLVNFNGNFGHDKLKHQMTNGAVQYKGFCAHYLSVIPSTKPSNLRTSALEPDCLGSTSLSTFRYIF